MVLEVTPEGYVVETIPPAIPHVWTDALDELLTGLPGTDALSDSMKETALAQSVVPDSAGVWPGKLGYEPTYDIYWAALSLLPFLQAQPVVTAIASEGTNVTVSAPSWPGLAAHYRLHSQIAKATQAPVLGTIPIPSVPHARKVDMSDTDWKGRRGHYGDVNTGV